MAQKLSDLGTKLLAAAANCATEMGGGTTTDEVQALARFIGVLGGRNDLTVPAIKLSLPTDQKEILPG